MIARGDGEGDAPCHCHGARIATRRRCRIEWEVRQRKDVGRLKDAEGGPVKGSKARRGPSCVEPFGGR